VQFALRIETTWLGRDSHRVERGDVVMWRSGSMVGSGIRPGAGNLSGGSPVPAMDLRRAELLRESLNAVAVG
jgi:hypothetical protein